MPFFARNNAGVAIIVGIASAAVTLSACGGANTGSTLLSTPELTHSPTTKSDTTKVFVANFTSNTVTVYDEEGRQIKTSGSFANLSSPLSIAFDSNNHRLYVTNCAGCSGAGPDYVTVYDDQGNRVSTSGNFNYPNLRPGNLIIDSHNGHIYTLSSTSIGGTIVEVFDEEGHPVHTSGGFPQMLHGGGLALDSNNHLLYSLNRDGFSRLYDEDGHLLRENFMADAGCPGSIAFDSDNRRLYVLKDCGTGGTVPHINVYDEEGNQIPTSGFTSPPLRSPAFLAFDSHNQRFYEVDDCTKVRPGGYITVFDEEGNQIQTIGSFPNIEFGTIAIGS